MVAASSPSLARTELRLAWDYRLGKEASGNDRFVRNDYPSGEDMAKRVIRKRIISNIGITPSKGSLLEGYSVADLRLQKLCAELRAELEVVAHSVRLARGQMSDPKSATYLNIAEDMLNQIGNRLDQMSPKKNKT